MIVTQNVSKKFGRLKALERVSFTINKGEIVGILGRNGAGKTTLMRIMTSYLTPTEGLVSVDGINVQQQSLLAREKLGYLPENPPLYMPMTVYEYLQFAAALKNVPSKQLKSKVGQALTECQLEPVAHKKIQWLSKGFKQRVGIAQAIVNDPDVLILDEPTNGLDPVQILQVRALIRSLEHKRTVIISTHILSEVEHLAKRVLIIDQGFLKVDQPMANICQEYGSLEKAFLNTVSPEKS